MAPLSTKISYKCAATHVVNTRMLNPIDGFMALEALRYSSFRTLKPSIGLFYFY
ncbi:hypothetical protein OOT00_00025 [Desulfobotulus sp. H1]|uniref:Uncharacterized protein n=1 Tax=Desulfobotulus pelophilus TaxID=2823377 RepID=A0ABT3N5D1_9BACT|nr:hypothetical protein [Desulfobotulus pelophilus]MCW7752371.1 hypothetical protein [Desulfobotulus pelophilus]